jgi:hypothetical protein
VLTHGDGIVDERFLTQVPNSPLKDSQRLVIRRADAEAALGDLAAGPRAGGQLTTESGRRIGL